MKTKEEFGYCDHIGILSLNAQRLVSFYTKNFNFKFTQVDKLAMPLVKKIFELNTECCFFRLENKKIKIEIFQPMRKPLKSVKSKLGIHHFGFVVKNQKEFLKRLKKKGVSILIIKRNKHLIYFVIDPDGNKIEIRQLP